MTIRFVGNRFWSKHAFGGEYGWCICRTPHASSPLLSHLRWCLFNCSILMCHISYCVQWYVSLTLCGNHLVAILHIFKYCCKIQSTVDTEISVCLANYITVPTVMFVWNDMEGPLWCMSKLNTFKCLCDHASFQYNDVNNQQDATTFSFINAFNSALHVLGDKFAHPQERFLTAYTAFCTVHWNCCRPVPRLRWNWIIMINKHKSRILLVIYIADHLGLSAPNLHNNSTLNLAQQGMPTHFQCWELLLFKQKTCYTLQNWISEQDYNAMMLAHQMYVQYFWPQHLEVHVPCFETNILHFPYCHTSGQDTNLCPWLYKDSPIYTVCNTYSTINNLTYYTMKHCGIAKLIMPSLMLNNHIVCQGGHGSTCLSPPPAVL